MRVSLILFFMCILAFSSGCSARVHAQGRTAVPNGVLQYTIVKNVEGKASLCLPLCSALIPDQDLAGRSMLEEDAISNAVYYDDSIDILLNPKTKFEKEWYLLFSVSKVTVKGQGAALVGRKP